MRPFTVVAISGFFDPLHAGHIEYIRDASLLGDKLVVILNADVQRRALRVTQEDRKVLVQAIRWVDEVVISCDADDSVCESLRSLRPDVFAKGGRPTAEEVGVCESLGIRVVTDVGRNIHFHDIVASLRA